MQWKLNDHYFIDGQQRRGLAYPLHNYRAHLKGKNGWMMKDVVSNTEIDPQEAVIW